MAADFADVGTLRLCYETFGDPGDEPLLLIAGLGSQMLSWDEKFCDRLAAEAFYVIRFDNRDSGLSTHIAGDVDMAAMLTGGSITTPYTLDDLADDAAELLRVLGVGPAHIVGVSMGGMIAQLVAVRHPRATRSLTSIMSTTGDRAVGQPAPESIVALMMQPSDEGTDAALQTDIVRTRTWESPQYRRSDAQIMATTQRAHDRAADDGGGLRQLAAIVTAHDRTEALGQVQVPTLVMHGEEDKLVDISGGRATVAAVPEAQLLTFPGMGHDLPFQLWPDFIAAIAANARRAGRPR